MFPADSAPFGREMARETGRLPGGVAPARQRTGLSQSGLHAFAEGGFVDRLNNRCRRSGNLDQLDMHIAAGYDL